MRAIVKGKEPESLAEYRNKVRNREDGYGGYDGYREKDELRESLIREQGCLCCYCCLGITKDSMRIEHWIPQATRSELALIYSNMLAACCGGEDGTKDERHCDVSKGDREIKYSPANPAHAIESKISYYSNGEIRSSCSEFDKQIDDVLNLNNEDFKSHRRTALQAIRKWKRSKGKTKGAIHAKITKLTDASGTLEPMSPVAVWYLRRIQKNS